VGRDAGVAYLNIVRKLEGVYGRSPALEHAQSPVNLEDAWGFWKFPTPHAPRTPLSDAGVGRDLLIRRSPERNVIAAERLLSRGRFAPTGTVRTVSTRSNVNNALPVETVVGRDGRRETAVIKSVAQGGAQEVFAYRVARALGIEYLLPTIGRRDDGAAAIEFVDGKGAWESLVEDSNGLEYALRDNWRARFPDMPAGDIARRSRIDRQLVQVFDYLLANPDRHSNNILINRETGEVKMIDHGLVGVGEPVERNGMVLEPRLRPEFSGTGVGVRGSGVQRTVTLLPEVVDILRGVRREEIGTAFTQMLRDLGSSREGGVHSNVFTDDWIDQLYSRLDYVSERGEFTIVTE
jgi:hypothetical protein